MQIKRTGIALRLASFCTLFVFLITSVSWSTPALPFQEIPLHSIPPDVSALAVPSELASVQEIFKGESGKPSVILIQDAHCVLDAQKHIAGLIDLFQKQHGLNLVALEGGAGKLDPVIFRAFPDRETKESVFNEYLKRGEISGAEWASILNEKPGAFWGVEDKKLYRLNKDAFVRTQHERGNLLHELERVKKLLDEFKRELYSNDLKELDTLVASFRQHHVEIEPLLTFLEKFEPHTAYPTITKLLAISEADLKAQKEKFLAELAAEDLFSEIEKYISSVRDKLSPSEDVRQLINLYDRLELLTDLAGLQMSRPAFEEYRLDRASYMPEQFQAFAERHGKFIDLAWNLDAHEEFYAIALKRDEVMYENVRNLLAKEDARFALFVAGGFHSSGISHKLKKEGISYIILTPRIDFMPEETTYEDVMNGEVSYKRFLNRQNDTLAPDLVVFPDSAFSKTAGLKLTEGIETGRLDETFQIWHDDIIRILAGEGRILKSGRYTRFVKGLFNLVRKNAAGELSDAELQESIENLLLKYTRPYFEQLKQNILSGLGQLSIEKPVLFPNIDPRLVLDSLVNVSNRAELTNYFENWDSVVRGGREFSDIPRASVFEGVRVAENAIREMDPRLSSAGVRAVAGDLLEHLESRNVAPDVFESWQASGSDISGFGAISLLKNRYVRNAVLVGTLIVGIFAAGVWKASKLEAASIHIVPLSQYQVILQKPNENPNAKALVPGPMYTEQSIKGVLTKVPTGWLVHEGKEINPFNKNSKGLAVQKAVFVIDKKGKIYIGKALDTYQETLAAISKAWKLKAELTIDAVEYAFQAGPIAMEDGKINDKLLDWLNSWAGRKVLIGIKENGDLITQEVFGLDPFGSDGPSGSRVIRILENMKREGVTYVIFGDGGSTFSGDIGIFGKPPIYELGAVQKNSIIQAHPSGFGANQAEHVLHELLDEVHAELGIPPFSPEKSGIELKDRKDLAQKHLHKRNTDWNIEDQISLLMSYFLDYSEKMENIGEKILARTQKEVLDPLMQSGDEKVFALPSVDDWLTLQMMYYVDDAIYENRAKQMAKWSLGASAFLLGLMGPHLRRQHDDGVDRGDMVIIPILMSRVLPRLEELLDKTEMARANGEYGTEFEREAKELTGALLNVFMFIPNHPFHSVEEGAERSFAFYRSHYFDIWMKQIELSGIREPFKIIHRAASAFPDLFPSERIPPFLLYWNDSAHGIGHMARVIKANQLRHLTGDEAITLWDTVSGSEKADAYRERTQEKVTGENSALVTDVTEKYFALLYPFLLSGGTEAGETIQATAKTGGFGAGTVAAPETTESIRSIENEEAERILSIFSEEIETANHRSGRLRFQPDRGSPARFLSEFFLSRAKQMGFSTLEEYEWFLLSPGPKQSSEKKSVLEKLIFTRFTSRADNDFELSPLQLDRFKELLMEVLVDRARTSKDRTLKFRVVGVGKNAYELKKISGVWNEIFQTAKDDYSEVFGENGLDDWDVSIDVYDLDAKTLETAEYWLRVSADTAFAKNVRLHWMDITDADYVRNQWLPEKADAIFMRNVLRGSLRFFPEIADFLLRGDVLNPKGLLVTDRATASTLLSLSSNPAYVVQDKKHVPSWILQFTQAVQAESLESPFQIQKLKDQPVRAFLRERISGKPAPVTIRLVRPSDAYELASEFYFGITADVNQGDDSLALAIESEEGRIEGVVEIRRPTQKEIDSHISEYAGMLAQNAFLLDTIITRRSDDTLNDVAPRFIGAGSLLMGVVAGFLLKKNPYLFPSSILLFLKAVPILGKQKEGDPEDFYLKLGMRPVSERVTNRLYWEKSAMESYVHNAFGESIALAGFGTATMGAVDVSAGEADFFNLVSNMSVGSLKSLHHSIYVDFEQNSDFYSGSMVNILRNGRSWERLFDSSYPTSESIRGRVRVSGRGQDFLYQVNGTAPLDLVRQQEIIRSAIEKKGELANSEEIIRHKGGVAEAPTVPWDSPEISAAAKVAAKVIAAFRGADGGPLVLNGKKGKAYTFDMKEIEDYRFGPDYPEALSDTTDYLIADRASVSFSLMVREEGLDEPVGKAFFSISPHPTDEQAVRVYWSNIEVHPEHRGRGGVAYLISVQFKDIFPEHSLLESIPTSADILILLAEKILAHGPDPKVEEALPILHRELRGEVFSDAVRGPINAHILGKTAVLFSTQPELFNNAEFFAELDRAYFSRYFGFRTVRVELDKRNRLPVFVREKSQALDTAPHGFGAAIAGASRAASVMAQLQQYLEGVDLTWGSERYGQISATAQEKKWGKRPSGKKVFSVSLRDEFAGSLSDGAREELSILKKKQPRDSFYPPMGSLGQLALYTTLIAGRPAIIILETQPSDGFRSLNRRARRALRNWSAESIRAIGQWGEQNNVLVFATSDQIMGSLYSRLGEDELKDYYRWPYTVANTGLWKEEKRLLSAGKHKIIQNGIWFAWAGNDYVHFDNENKTYWLDILLGPDSSASKELANLEILGPDRDIYENAFHALAVSLTADDLADLISRSVQLKEMSSGLSLFISALIKNLDAVSGFKIIEERLRDLDKTVSPSLSSENKKTVRNIVSLLDTFYAHEIGGEVFFSLREIFQVFRKNLDDESKDWFDDITEMIRTRLRSQASEATGGSKSGFGTSDENKFVPEDFGKEPYTQFQIGGTMKYPITVGSTIDVRKIETQVVPLDMLNRFSLGNSLTFQIVPLGGGAKGISPFEAPLYGQVEVAAPAAGYLLQLWLDGKWIDLDEVDLQDGIPIVIKRGSRPKHLNPVLQKDLEENEKFGPGLEAGDVNDDPYNRLAIFWMEGGLQKTVYLPRRVFATTLSRGIERDVKRPGFDLNTQTYLEGYLQTGHVEIELMDDSVKFADLGSSNGTQIEVNKEWLEREAGRMSGALLNEASEDGTEADGINSIELTEGMNNIDIKPNHMIEFSYQKPFSVAAMVHMLEKAKVDVEVRKRGKVLYVKEQATPQWRPARDNDYVARQYLPVAGQESLSEVEASQVTGGYRIKYDRATKKISIFNFSASRLRVAFEPGPGESMGPVGFGTEHLSAARGFGAARMTDYVTGEQLLNALKRKFEIRSILRGGPIRQPDFFRAIERDSATITRMKSRYKNRTFDDRSFMPIFAASGDVVRFEDLADLIVSGQVHAPLVFKPNGSAVGEGIFFIERDDKKLVLTMSALDGFYSQSRTEIIERYLRAAGVKYNRDQNKGIMQISLSLEKHAQAILSNIWALISRTENEKFGTYDSGMVEGLIPAIRYNGMAYETRHPFQGNLLTGESSPIIIHDYEGGLGGWYGKLGSSSYFAKQIGRSGSSALPFERMFDPLFEQLNIDKKRRKEFQLYVEKFVRDEFMFLVQRLQQMGIRADYLVTGQFDLMWFPPEAGSNGFPIPVLIEAGITAPDQDGRGKKYVIRPAAGFGFENIPTDIEEFESNYRRVIANLAKELTGIIRSNKTFDEDTVREKLESVLPDLHLGSEESEKLWVELFILKSRLEFFAQPVKQSKAAIPTVNVGSFTDSMPDHFVRAKAVEDISRKILGAFPSSRKDSGSAVVVYTWETFPRNTADILALAEKISKGDRLVLFHKPDDDLSAITDLLKKNNGLTLTSAQTSGLLEILKNKRIYYDKLNPIEVNKARGLEQGLSVLLKEVLQVQNGTVGGINTKFVLVLNQSGLYENFEGLSGLIQEVSRSLAHLDSMRRRSGSRRAIDAGLLEKEILDRISRFGFVSGTDGRGGQIISFNLAVFLRRVQESYNALMQTSVAA